MRVTFLSFIILLYQDAVSPNFLREDLYFLSSYIALTYHLYLCGQQSLVFVFSPPFSSDPLYSDRHATIYIRFSAGLPGTFLPCLNRCDLHPTISEQIH